MYIWRTMVGARHNVLYVGDATYATTLASNLERHKTIRIDATSSVQKGLERLADGNVDCLVTEASPSGEQWETFLTDAARTAPDVPVVLFMANTCELDAVADGGDVQETLDNCIVKWAVSDCHRLLASRISNTVAAH